MRGHAPTAKVDVDAMHCYGLLVVHEQLKFTVAANELICICGPSGCGKTTLLDMLAGILKPSQGHVLIDGVQADLMDLVRDVDGWVGKCLYYSFLDKAEASLKS